MVTTSAELDEMARLIEDLEGFHEALPMLIFILKLSVAQARVSLRTGEGVSSLLREVDLLPIDVEAL